MGTSVSKNLDNDCNDRWGYTEFGFGDSAPAQNVAYTTDAPIVTPQEPEIRQQENRMEQAQSQMHDAKVEAVGGAVGLGAGVAADQPYATAIAGGAVIHSIGRGSEGYFTYEEAKERYDMKVQEEKDYIASKRDE